MRSRNVSTVMFPVVGTVTCSALRLVQQRDGPLGSDKRCAVSPHLGDAIIVDGSTKSPKHYFFWVTVNVFRKVSVVKKGVKFYFNSRIQC